MLELLQTYTPWLLVGQYPSGPIGGLALTLFLAVTGLVCAFPLSVLVGIARSSESRWARAPAFVIVHIVRGLPVLMLIFWCYYVIPLLFGRSVPGIATLIAALIFYEMAFLGEVVRAGIQAIPKGQIEAARSLGLSRTRCMLDIVLPQALFNMIPSILSQFINLIKNTSLGYIISVEELTYFGHQINSTVLTRPMEVFLMVAAFYFVVCFSLARLVGWTERHVRRRRGNLIAQGGEQ